MTRKPRDKASDAVRNAPLASSAPKHTPVDGFEMSPRGLYRVMHGRDGKPGGAFFVADCFEVLAETRNADGGAWGLHLRWRDRDSRIHQWIAPRAMLAGEAAELRSTLAERGLTIASSPAARAALSEFLTHQRPKSRVRTTPRTGWFDMPGVASVFVLPDATTGRLPEGEDVLLELPGPPPAIYRSAGTLDAWQAGVAARCAGNSVLVFAMSCGFAGPLLHLLGEQGGGINIYGKSRSGKTTALHVAASVWGAPRGHTPFAKSWRATGNALEAVAAEHSDTLLPLDEIGQVEPREIGECAYMLAAGMGKARAQREGRSRAVTTWRVLFLSSGEMRLADVMAQAGQRPQAGQEVRLVDLPADAGAGMGAFECLHSAANPAALAEMLDGAVRAAHGTAGPAFLVWVQARWAGDPDWPATLCHRQMDFLAAFLPPGADAQVRTVARRFALVAIGGELATQAGVTGWAEGEAWRAAGMCFRRWLQERGGTGAREDMEAIARIRACIAADGNARFELWRDRPDAEVATTTEPPPEGRAVMKRLGWRRWVAEAALPGGGAWDYYFTPDGFREVLGGLDVPAAARALARAGYLRSGSRKEGSSVTARVPGQGVLTAYHVLAAIMAHDAPPEGVTAIAAE